MLKCRGCDDNRIESFYSSILNQKGNPICKACMQRYRKERRRRTRTNDWTGRFGQQATKCLRCEKEFFPEYREKRFCSKTCSNRYNAKLRQPNNPKPKRPKPPSIPKPNKICEHCQGEYRPVHTKQKFCSKACQYSSSRKPLVKPQDRRRKIRIISNDGTHMCMKCDEFKTAENFYIDRKKSGGLKNWCKDCQKGHAKQHNEVLRREVIAHYGSCCACCGEIHSPFLTIDHIDGGGGVHRKELNIGSGNPFYYWLKKNNFPEGFRILCHNRNFALGHYGYCPHKANEKQASVKTIPKEMMGGPTKECARCSLIKSMTLKYFSINNKMCLGFESWCKDCHNETRRIKNREERIQVLSHYGGNPPSCALCSEKVFEFLAIDHINGGGKKHMNSVGYGSVFTKWLLKSNFPEGFRILCHNHNFVTAHKKYDEVSK